MKKQAKTNANADEVTSVTSDVTGNVTRSRPAQDIEKLLHWCYREELPKRQTSSAEGIWDRIADIGERGGIDPGHGAAQRYPHFGLPHPDAETIEKAVAGLEDAVIDWEVDAWSILGELVALVEPRPPREPEPRKPTASWRDRGGARQREVLERPRTVLLVRSLRTSALVTMHAGMGTRPDWREEAPTPLPTPAKSGPNAAIIGECRGRNRYTDGSYCPLQWSPSPIAIAQIRLDYLAWWRGLNQLARSLQLQEYKALPPSAPEMPWETPETAAIVRSELWPQKHSVLPLKPARKLAGPPPSRPRRRRRVPRP